MKNVLVRYTLAATLLAVSASAMAQQPAAEAAARQASFAIQFWMDSCMTNFANPAGVGAFAAKYGLPEAAMQAEVLRNRAGKAWAVVDSERTVYLLAQYANGECQVMSRYSDRKTATEALVKIMEIVKSREPNLIVRRLDDQSFEEPIDAKLVKYQRISYYVSRNDVPIAWRFRVDTHDTPDVPTQLILATEPIAKQ